jgi:hypothetical protein
MVVWKYGLSLLSDTFVYTHLYVISVYTLNDIQNDSLLYDLFFLSKQNVLERFWASSQVYKLPQHIHYDQGSLLNLELVDVLILEQFVHSRHDVVDDAFA